jgi:hypothetical protein
MDLRSRVGLAFILLGCFLGAMVVLDLFGETVLPPVSTELVPGTLLDQSFTRAGFLYGPQSWRPGYDPQGIEPGEEIDGNKTWYLMFIDLNATPVSGNPNVKRLGAVRITYNLTQLDGRAVFHVYGLTDSTAMPTRTNRQTGNRHSAFMVEGRNVTTSSSMPAATPLPVPASHQYRIAIANNQLADADTLSSTTRALWFNGPLSGQGSLHITPGLSNPRGDVTETQELNGTFFVTATGGDPGYDLLLLAAVDRPQPEGFSLRVRTAFVRTG